MVNYIFLHLLSNASILVYPSIHIKLCEFDTGSIALQMFEVQQENPERMYTGYAGQQAWQIIGGVADNLPHFFVDSLLVRRLLQMWQCFRLSYFFGKNLFYLIF